MALTINSGNSILDTDGGVALLPGAQHTDQITIASSGYVHGYGPSGTGIFLYDTNGSDFVATNWNVNVAGAVGGFSSNGAGSGIVVAGAFQGAFASIAVQDSGSVVGSTGIDVFGGAFIENRGVIRGLTGSGIKYDFSAFTVNNYVGGLIEGNGGGYGIQIGSGATTVVNNAGVITGPVGIQSTGTARLALNNTGTVVNGLSLGGTGDDVINTSNGRIIESSYLGGGSDRYIGSNVYTDFVIGASGDDFLFGLGNADRLEGREGFDTLDGGRGRDALYGGTDNDTFIYRSTLDSGVTSTTRDTIFDFDQVGKGNDVLDLRRIDAISGGVDNVFTYRGTAAFTGVGQIRVIASGADTIVQLNTTGSLAADSTIFLQGTSIASMGIDDFLR